jgi:hypothetical protein
MLKRTIPQLNPEDDEISAAIKPFDKRKAGKDKAPVRGVETMIRVTSTNHQRLSDMADNKAHIMISVNSIILSIVIGWWLVRLIQLRACWLPYSYC